MSRYLVYECEKPGCRKRKHQPYDYCLNHIEIPGERLFIAWFLFCAVIAVTVLVVGIWAVISLVQWMTS